MTDLQEALIRDKKIHQTNYVVPPKGILSSLHKKTHYKGATDVRLGVNSMKIKTKLFNEDFIAVAQSLPSFNGERTFEFKESRVPATAVPAKRNKNKPLDSDEEDRRLDRIQKMQN